ncbi:hypothetical protein GCM10023237_56320 [Streptomyces coeruleoprunus]
MFAGPVTSPVADVPAASSATFFRSSLSAFMGPNLPDASQVYEAPKWTYNPWLHTAVRGTPRVAKRAEGFTTAP